MVANTKIGILVVVKIPNEDFTDFRGRSHITSAAGGGRGGKPKADHCWRGGEGG